MVEFVLCYGKDVWIMREEEIGRSRNGLSHKPRITNACKTIVDIVEKGELKLVSHLLRMSSSRRPKRQLGWTQPGTIKRERPRRPWTEKRRETKI